MGKKSTKHAANRNDDLATSIKLGTRVRHAEDNVEGRIVWANASAVKIEWDDGEKVTWKRSELGAKGLVVIDSEDAPEPQAPEGSTPPADEPARPEAPELQQPAPGTPEIAPLDDTAAPEISTPLGQVSSPEPAVDQTTEGKPGKKARTRKPKAEAGEKKSSALDAAAKVLAEEKRPMSTKELIGLMAAKGYWTSPGGKTPAATLYSAILREMDTKGGQARFEKVGKGQFKLRPQA
jgi:hypothetical protein